MWDPSTDLQTFIALNIQINTKWARAMSRAAKEVGYGTVRQVVVTIDDEEPIEMTLEQFIARVTR